MVGETQILSRLSPNVVVCPSNSQAGVGNPDGAYLSQRDHHPQPPILPNLPTIYNLFMQNKPNLVRLRRIANDVIIKDYEDEIDFWPAKNKPKTNPILSASGGLVRRSLGEGGFKRNLVKMGHHE